MNRIFTQDLEALKHWLMNTWFRDSKSSAYQSALQSAILQLWPDLQSDTIGTRAYTFLNVPALCFHSLGGNSASILPINCAWIFLYAAFYLLDKVEDQETGHVLFSQFGEGPATNLTTGLILNAGEILSTVGQEAQEFYIVQAIQADFYRLAAAVCAGQHLDLTVKEPDFETTWAIAAAKSGIFFSLGCKMGATLSGAVPEQVDAFARYGRHLGTLIQIANDFEGLFPTEHGKSDIIAGKHNLPIAYTFHVLPDNEKTVLQELLSASESDLQAKNQALRIIIQSGALVYLYFEAEKQKALAANALESLALVPEMKEILLSLPEKVASGLRQSGN